MNALDLQQQLLDEIPAPGPSYWTEIHSTLNPASDKNAGPTDITATDVALGPQPGPRRTRALRRLGLAAAAVLLLGALVVTSRVAGRSADETDLAGATGAGDVFDLPLEQRPGPRQNHDHWHAVYGVWDCTADDGQGGWLPPFQSTRDETGIHSHGDGLISIHPFFERSAGSSATFSHFADEMGIGVTDQAITLDDGRSLEAGTDCAGEPAVVQMRRWEFDLDVRNDPRLEPRIVLGDFGTERFYNDREVWTLALAPVGAEIPLPPDERFHQLDKWWPGGDPLDLVVLDPETDEPARRIPRGDIYVTAQPYVGIDPSAENLLRIRFQQTVGQDIEAEHVMPGSVRYVATLQSGERVLDLFRYQADRDASDCVATFSAQPAVPGSFVSCSAANPTTRINWGHFDPITVVHLLGAPEAAAWMVIQTGDGSRVVTEIVGRFGYAEWSTAGGEPTQVTLLDAKLEFVWSTEDFD